MKIEHLISDADGVIIDSQKFAWENAYKIVRLFHEISPFDDLSEYKRNFSRKAQIELVGEKESETLRSMHRLLMRHSAKKLKCFNEVIDIYRKINIKKSIVTSAYASGIKEVLGENAKDYFSILGRESGRKIEVLKTLISGNEIYVTDSVSDINICKEVGIRVIATGWGYDTPENLKDQHPNFFVNNPLELDTLFHKLNLN